LITGAAKQGCIYFAVNIAQCRCTSCGKLFIGKFDKSPCHDANVIHFLRVVGFLTPVENWIPERRTEYKIRQFYGTNDF
jgi:anaerobic ribonucleoside-triphosphate reductase